MGSVFSHPSDGSPECELFGKSGKPTRQLVEGPRGSCSTSALQERPSARLVIHLTQGGCSEKLTLGVERKAACHIEDAGQRPEWSGHSLSWPSFHPFGGCLLNALCARHHVL